jgi:hypothetical protein
MRKSWEELVELLKVYNIDLQFTPMGIVRMVSLYDVPKEVAKLVLLNKYLEASLKNNGEWIIIDENDCAVKGDDFKFSDDQGEDEASFFARHPHLFGLK